MAGSTSQSHTHWIVTLALPEDVKSMSERYVLWTTGGMWPTADDQFLSISGTEYQPARPKAGRSTEPVVGSAVCTLHSSASSA